MQTDIHSYTDKQADMKTQRDKQACRQTYTVTDKQANMKIQSDRHADRHTELH